MRSTQLSESFNSDLKRHLKSDLNLMEFFTQFERVVNGKRYNESEAEKDSIDKLPIVKMKKAPMLVQASKVYTPCIYKEFQEEYEEFLGAYVIEHKEEHSKHVYRIANVNNTKERIVLIDTTQNVVSCDCSKFETHGILCSHALKVLDVMNIKLIPEQYIL
jgi:SWIM zinc finger